jgi:hypothetical protein
MPRADKLLRYPDVVAWRKANPERKLAQDRTACATYRGKPGTAKRRRYNEAQRLRAIKRQARAAARKALEKAQARAVAIITQRSRDGFSGALKPKGF